MKKIEIIERTLLILQRNSISFTELYIKQFEVLGVKKSELAACIKDLKQEGFIDYEGDFNDNNDVVLKLYGEEMLAKHDNYARYMQSKPSETLYDRLIRAAKNNYFLAVGIIIVGVGAALFPFWKDIKGLFEDSPKKEVVNILELPEEDDEFCGEVTRIFNSMKDEFQGLKTTSVDASKWKTNVALPGMLSSEILRVPLDSALYCYVRFYEGRDKNSAQRIYANVVNQICVGKIIAELKYPGRNLIYTQVQYGSYYAITTFDTRETEPGKNTYIVELYFEYASW
jgi:hypothetical protein